MCYSDLDFTFFDFFDSTLKVCMGSTLGVMGKSSIK